MLEPGRGMVQTLDPDGVSNPLWLGALGHVNQLTWSYTLPGGPDQMQCTLQQEATFRTLAMNPGRVVKVHCGGQVVWVGILDEPAPSAAGWTVTAHGAGTWGADYAAIWTTWTDQNDAINQAIARGLQWINPGVPSDVWLGQSVDSGSQTITDLLNLFCTNGGLTWAVEVTPAGNILNVFDLPTVPDRILVCGSPVPRTLGGDIDVIWVNYQVSDDSGSDAATTALVAAETAAEIPIHGRMETYLDLSSAGTMSAGAAQAVGQAILQQYQRASFAGPFTVRYGELLNIGGAPVDLAMEQAGHVCKVILTDYGYGGEIVPGPVTFLVGGYQYDDTGEFATVTPFQSLDTSMSGLLSAMSTTIQPAPGLSGSNPLSPVAGSGTTTSTAKKKKKKIMTMKSTPHQPPSPPRRVVRHHRHHGHVPGSPPPN